MDIKQGDAKTSGRFVPAEQLIAKEKEIKRLKNVVEMAQGILKDKNKKIKKLEEENKRILMNQVIGINEDNVSLPIDEYDKLKQNKFEVIAEGKVVIDDEDGEIWVGEGEYWIGWLKKLEGKNIQIGVRVIEKHQGTGKRK